MLRALALAVLLAPGPIGPTAHADVGRPMCKRGAKYRGAPIDLDVKDADIHDVMRLLADVGGVNIVVPDSVKAKVTLRLKRVAWDLVACTIAAVHHLELTARDNVILVRRR